MKDTKFTKGDWVVDNAGDVIIKGSGGYVGYPSHDGAIASLNDGEYIENHNSHDAHLIASAPAMYKALEALSKSAVFRDNHNAMHIDELLKTARGE